MAACRRLSNLHGALAPSSSAAGQAPPVDMCTNAAAPRGWHRTRGESDRKLRVEFLTQEGRDQPAMTSIPLLGKDPSDPQRHGYWAPKCSTAPLLPLWPGGAVPLAQGPAAGEDPEAMLPNSSTYTDFLRDWGTAHTWRGAHVPALQVFSPPPGVEPTGASAIVCPGGGWSFLAPHEGVTIAGWLAAHGVTAFVLRYRLAVEGYQYPAPVLDLQRAIRFVRHHAASFSGGLDGRVMAIGFSAGGHLVSCGALHGDAPDLLQAADGGELDAIDRCSSRLDCAVPVYPCTQLAGELADRLCTSEADKARYCCNTFAARLNASGAPQPPPQLLIHSTGDQLLEADVHADVYAAALARNGAECEYIKSEWGGHGVGLHGAWGPRCLEWLSEQSVGFAHPPSSMPEYEYKQGV